MSKCSHRSLGQPTVARRDYKNSTESKPSHCRFAVHPFWTSLLALLCSTAGLGQAAVTVTPSPLFQRYNFYYSGLHGENAYGYHLDGDTFQCVWASDGSTYCEANDSHDNGSSASLMIGKFDSTFTVWSSVNGFQSSGDMIGYGTIAESCVPQEWCQSQPDYPNFTPVTDGSWKSCGMYDANGILYACVTYNHKNYPYSSAAATVIESDDGGSTWCNPSHTQSSGCVSTTNGPVGDVPYPGDVYPQNPTAIRGLHFIKYGEGNASLADNNSTYAYAYLGTYLVRIPLSQLPELSETDVQFYPNWDSTSDGSIPSDAVALTTPGGRIDNVQYLPGPNVYVSGINNLVDSSSITYQGDSHIMTAPHPWGPWYTAGEDISQPTWNFGPDFLGSTKDGSGPWIFNDIESGYYLLTTGYPDSNGYSPGFRGMTITSGGPSAPPSQLDTDMKSVAGLDWFYDGLWRVNYPDNWFTIPDVSANGNNLTSQQYSSSAWNNEITTYSQQGLAGFNGYSAQAVGVKQPSTSGQTYFLVFRHCCRAPTNYEEVMAGNSSQNYDVGIDVQRDGTKADSWQVVDFGASSSDLTLVDGSYHLVVIQQSGSTVNLYTSNSLSNTPANGGTVTPVAHFNATPGTNLYQTVFGNLNGNTNSGANFFQGTLVMAAAYNEDIGTSNIANLIYDIRMDLVNDNVSGYAAVKRHVYVPLSFQGTYPLDYQPQPLASYSVRRMSTNYSGPILQVTGGKDIYADSNGNITSSLQSACAGVTCYVTIWYDQSGNAYNLSQTSTPNQPMIVNEGVINKDPNGNPTLSFSGTSWMETGTSSLIFVTDAASLHAVASNAKTFQNGGALAFLANPYSDSHGVSIADMATGMLMGYTNNGYVNAYRDGVGQAELRPAVAGGFFSATSVYDSYSHRMYVDGSEATPVHNAGTYSSGYDHPSEFYAYDFVVGWDKDGNGGGSTDIHWQGNISEVLLYNYALTDDSANVLQHYDAGYFGTGNQ